MEGHPSPINCDDITGWADKELAKLDRMRQELEEVLGNVKSQALSVLESVNLQVTTVKESLAAARKRREEWERDHERQQRQLSLEAVQIKTDRLAFEEEKQRMGKGTETSDILSINLGGERTIQRRRSTLCVVEGSFLASRFSGRWDGRADLDKDGHHFLNYPPELMMPVLDYLSMRETEGPDCFVPLPDAPRDDLRPQFEAMLRFLGLSPVKRSLDAVSTPYESVSLSCYGLAFELRARVPSMTLLSVESCSQTDLSSATVFSCEGELDMALGRPSAWAEIGRGALAEGRSSRIEFAEPLKVKCGVTQCIYIATDKTFGIAYVGPESEGVSAENNDLQLFAARFSGSGTHFDGFYTRSWYHFNGQIEYSVIP